jgi:hypothetical protein
MIKPGSIATGNTDTVTVAELLKTGYSARAMVCREDNPNAQSKRRGSLITLFRITALFLLSLSTHGAFAGEIKPYNQPEFEKLAAEGKPILLDFRADRCTVCAAQTPVIRELMAQSKYKDLTNSLLISIQPRHS